MNSNSGWVFDKRLIIILAFSSGLGGVNNVIPLFLAKISLNVFKYKCCHLTIKDKIRFYNLQFLNNSKNINYYWIIITNIVKQYIAITLVCFKASTMLDIFKYSFIFSLHSKLVCCLLANISIPCPIVLSNAAPTLIIWLC